jgi:hypothetical protein
MHETATEGHGSIWVKSSRECFMEERLALCFYMVFSGHFAALGT